jgi:predicted PurR-regulated permease PerM
MSPGRPSESETPAVGAEFAAPAAAGEAPNQTAAPVEAQVEEGVAVRAGRYSRNTVALIVLAAIAFVAGLYFARAFVVPLLIGILTSYALRPLVDALQNLRLPRPAAAALVLAVIAGGTGWIGYSLTGEMEAMLEKLPEAARKLRQNLSETRSTVPNALQNVQEAANELQRAATDAAQKPGTRPSPAPAAAPAIDTSSWLRNYALAQSALLISVAAQAPIVFLLAYFLLASGDHFRRKLVKFVGPSLSAKKDAVRILEEIDTQVQRYLFVMVSSNTVVAICTWLAFKTMGVEQAGVWGLIAGVLHFIPYLGTLVLATMVGVSAFLQFGSLLHALIVAGVAMVIGGMVGMVFMTWLQSRFARVNAAVLFIALLFFGWLWGIAGLLLGAPIVAIAKVICDRVESLKPAGEMMGR